MQQKTMYLGGVIILLLGVALGYAWGVQQTLRMVQKSAPPAATSSSGQSSTVPGYMNPYAVYKNPFR